MNTTTKLIKLKENKMDVKIMIMGLGSVGQYLLDYLCSAGDERIEIIVAGRNKDKMQQDVNIVRVAAAIRGKLRTKIKIVENSTGYYCKYKQSVCWIKIWKYIMEKFQSIRNLDTVGY